MEKTGPIKISRQVKDSRPATALSSYDAKLSTRYSHIKDPRIKSRRFDYQIFFPTKKRPNTINKSISAPKHTQKKNSSFPARFCSVDKKVEKKSKPDWTESDLQLIKKINSDTEMQELHNQKVYRDYVINYQSPANTQPHSELFSLTQKYKKVRFNLNNSFQ